MISRTDVLNIINRMEAQNLIRVGKVTGSWMTIYCPFHSNGTEKKPSCGIHLEDEFKNGQMYKAGQFHCFACGASYSLQHGIDIILKDHAVPVTSSDWIRQVIPDFDGTSSEKYGLIPQETMSAVLTNYAVDNLRMRFQAESNFVREEELASYRFTVPYMYQRRLTDEVIERYDIGYDANFILPGRKKATPCVTFPVRDKQGRTLFFCRRSIEGKLFHYPEGVTKPVYGIYELPPNARSVIVCESCFNALTCVVYGYNAVALLGTGNSYQLDQLKRLGVQEYVICLDPDEAGARGTAKLIKALSDYAIVWRMTLPPGKDVNDCEKWEIDQAFQNKE